MRRSSESSLASRVAVSVYPARMPCRNRNRESMTCISARRKQQGASVCECTRQLRQDAAACVPARSGDHGEPHRTVPGRTWMEQACFAGLAERGLAIPILFFSSSKIENRSPSKTAFLGGSGGCGFQSTRLCPIPHPLVRVTLREAVKTLSSTTTPPTTTTLARVQPGRHFDNFHGYFTIVTIAQSTIPRHIR